jgi:hypothetical protein
MSNCPRLFDTITKIVVPLLVLFGSADSGYFWHFLLMYVPELIILLVFSTNACVCILPN